MAMFDYTDRLVQKSYNQMLNKIQTAFTIFFSVEAALRMIGMGFIIHKNSYFRDPWNWLDFFTVLIGWIEIVPEIPRLTYIRTLRVIRPLRSIKAIPSMRRLISSLLQSLPMLANVVLFLFFFFMLFGILGVSLFKGDQYSRCRLTDSPNSKGEWPIDQTQESLCSTNSNQYQCKVDTYCGNPEDFNLGIDFAHSQDDKLNFYGMQSFDHLGDALLTIFQVITLEGWAKLMYNLEDTEADYLSPIYFVIIVIFGGFFLLNLILAVIMDSFAKVDKLQKMQELQDQLKKLDIQSKRTVLQSMRTKGSGIQNQGTSVFSKAQQVLELNKKIKSKIEEAAEEDEKDQDSFRSDTESIYTEQKFTDEEEYEKGSINGNTERDETANNNNLLDGFKNSETAMARIKKVKTFSSPDFLNDDPNEQDNKLKDSYIKEKSFDQGQEARLSTQNQNEVKRQISQKINEVKKKIDKERESQTHTLSQSAIDTKQLDTKEIEYQDDLKWRLKKHRIYEITYKICSHKLFSATILLLIIANTIDLFLDRYPITSKEENLLDQLNEVFFGCFQFEMLIKLLAFGPVLYVRDKFNIFDAVINVLSIADITIKYSSQYQIQYKVLIAFRAIRLLRVFKLAKQWQSLQDMLTKIGRTFKDISNFLILLYLFTFTYALLGMELFAYKVKFDDNNNPINMDNCNNENGCENLGISPRSNFDTWPNAMITIFVLLVGDDWNQYMFDYVRATNQWSIIFFVSLTAFGNLLLLNLFLAILLKDFEQNHENDSKFQKKTIDKIKDFLRSIFYKVKCWHKKAKIYEIQNLDQSVKAKNEEEDVDSFNFSKSDQSKSNSVMNSPRMTVQDNNGKKQLTSNQDNQNSSNGIEEQGQINSNRPFIIKINDSINNSFNQDDSQAEIIKVDSKKSKMKKNQIQVISNTLQVFETNNILIKDSSHTNDNNNYPKKGRNDSKLSNTNFMTYSNKNSHIAADPVDQDMSLNHNPYEQKIALFSKTLTENQLKTQLTIEGKSLYIFDKESKLRMFIVNLVRMKLFDAFIIILIISSTVTLALDQPLSDPDSEYNKTLYYCDMSFSFLFGLECVLKIIAYGLILNGKNSYFLSPWNVMDFLIAIFSLISLISTKELKLMKSLRLMRIMRMISKNEGLRIAVLCLINSLKDILNVFVIALFSFIVYAIFGVNFFKGEFYYCYQDHLKSNMPLGNENSQYFLESFSKWECLSNGGEWLQNRSNFDNIFYGCLTLFQMATTEGWVENMWNGIDSTDIDYTQQQDSNTIASLYFICFILLGSLFIMNMFVGVVINTFKYEKEKIGQNFLLSDTQKEWVKVQIKCYKSKPQPKDPDINSRFQKAVAFIGQSFIFEMFIHICIVLNSCILACNWYLMPPEVENAFEIVNNLFTGIFTVEAIIKLITSGKLYFKEGWNLFDLIILGGTYIQLFTTHTFNRGFGAHATILRIFRIGRVLRLVKQAQRLKSIFITLIITIPSLANIGFILFLLIYLYAILGVNLFGKVKIHGELNDHANFQTFINAFLTLIRCATGESWNDIMKSLMDQQTITYDCIDDPTYQDIVNNNGVANGCGSYWSAMIFFTSYQLIVTFIFLNLFIAIILEGFRDTNEDQNLRVDDIMIAKFKKLWQSYDPEGTGYINVKEINSFLTALIKKDTGFIRGGDYLLSSQQEMNKFIAELHLPTYHKFKSYNYIDILNHLCKTIFKIDFDKIAILKTEQSIHKSATMRSFKETTSIHNYFQNQDQLEFDSFEELMVNFNDLIKDNKIQLYEEYKNLRLMEDRKKMRFRDRFEGKYYDSRVIIYLPILIKKLQYFTQLMKEKRKTQSNFEIQRQAEKEIQQLKVDQASQIQKLADRQKRNSIFVTLAQNSKVLDQLTAQKTLTNQMDSQNTLSPFRGQITNKFFQQTTLGLGQQNQQTLNKMQSLFNQQQTQIQISQDGSDLNSQDSFIKKEESITGGPGQRSSNASNNTLQQYNLLELSKNNTLGINQQLSTDQVNQGIIRIGTSQSAHALEKKPTDIIEEDEEYESVSQDSNISSKQSQKKEQQDQLLESESEKASQHKSSQSKLESVKSIIKSSTSSQESEEARKEITKMYGSLNTAENMPYIQSQKLKYLFQEIIDEKSCEETRSNHQNNQFIVSIRKASSLQMNNDEIDDMGCIDKNLSFDEQLANLENENENKDEGYKVKIKDQNGDDQLIGSNRSISKSVMNRSLNSMKGQKSTFGRINQAHQEMSSRGLSNHKKGIIGIKRNEVEEYSGRGQIGKLEEDKFDDSKEEEDKNEFIDMDKLGSSDDSIQSNESKTERLNSNVLQIQFRTKVPSYKSNNQLNSQNYSQMTFGFGMESQSRLGSRLESRLDSQKNSNSKKISSKTTQFYFNSQQDMVQFADKKSSNKLSSTRYQNIWNNDEQENIESNPRDINQELNFPKANEEVKTSFQKMKLRELLDIDIDSSYISSDLYQDTRSLEKKTSSNIGIHFQIIGNSNHPTKLTTPQAKYTNPIISPEGTQLKLLNQASAQQKNVNADFKDLRLSGLLKDGNSIEIQSPIMTDSDDGQLRAQEKIINNNNYPLSSIHNDHNNNIITISINDDSSDSNSVKSTKVKPISNNNINAGRFWMKMALQDSEELDNDAQMDDIIEKSNIKDKYNY